MKVAAFIKKDPISFNMYDFCKSALSEDGVAELGPVTGMCFFGFPVVWFNTYESLEDLYLNKN
jgi:hypothetical protein